jgi:hypothetical protein
MRSGAIVSLWVAVIAAGCTSLHPTEAPSTEVQRLIREEQLIVPHDRVRLVTTDGVAHEFRVARVDLAHDVVTGRRETVPIADIVTVQTRKIAVGKTTALAAGLYVGIGMLIIMTVLPLAVLTGF